MKYLVPSEFRTLFLHFQIEDLVPGLPWQQVPLKYGILTFVSYIVSHIGEIRGNKKPNNDQRLYVLFRIISHCCYCKCMGYFISPIKRDQHFHEADDRISITHICSCKNIWNKQLNSRNFPEICDNMPDWVAMHLTHCLSRNRIKSVN